MKSIWLIERKARRGWILSQNFIGTKRDVAKLWCKHFRGREPIFRLVHKMTCDNETATG